MLTDSELIRREQRKTVFRVVPPSDWRVLLHQRTNVLVSGPKTALDAFVRMAQSEMREPILSSTGGRLPPLDDDLQTLIISDVASLSDANQKRLRQWIERHPDLHPQIIALTSVPLFALVASKAFDASLYYRLNTILLELQEG